MPHRRTYARAHTRSRARTHPERDFQKISLFVPETSRNKVLTRCQKTFFEKFPSASSWKESSAGSFSEKRSYKVKAARPEGRGRASKLNSPSELPKFKATGGSAALAGDGTGEGEHWANPFAARTRTRTARVPSPSREPRPSTSFAQRTWRISQPRGERLFPPSLETAPWRERRCESPDSRWKLLFFFRLFLLPTGGGFAPRVSRLYLVY